MESWSLSSGRLSPEAPEAAGAVAAVFEHRQNAGAEPHLHSHVLLANLASTPHGTWVSPNEGQWRNERRALFALYQLELRHDLARAGWELDWRNRADGTADLADVPRAAVRATSSQTWSTHERGRFETRRLATPQPWLDRSIAHGFGPEDAPARPALADGRRAIPAEGLSAPGLDQVVAKRILAERSVFRRCDVAVALAACLPQGAAIDAVDAWTDRFLIGAQLVPSVWSTPRWTTELAAESDRRLAGVIRERSLGSPFPGDIEPALGHFAYLTDPERQSVERLVTSGNRVEIIGNRAGQSGLMAAAAVIDAGRTSWEADGLSVAVMCSAGGTPARWEALAGLVPPYQSGSHARCPGRRPGRPADHAGAPLAPHGHAGPDSADPGRGRHHAPDCRPLPAPVCRRSATSWDVSIPGSPARPTPTLAPDGAERDGPGRSGYEGSERQAIGELVDSWAQRWAETSAVHLVGLGIDEVSDLNRRARDALFQGVRGGRRQARGPGGRAPLSGRGPGYRPARADRRNDHPAPRGCCRRRPRSDPPGRYQLATTTAVWSSKAATPRRSATPMPFSHGRPPGWPDPSFSSDRSGPHLDCAPRSSRRRGRPHRWPLLTEATTAAEVGLPSF